MKLRNALFLTAIFCSLTLLGCSNDGDDDGYDIVTEFPEGKTVWSGTSQFLYSDAGWYSLPKGYITAVFSNVEEGDLILITHSENWASNYDWRAFEFQSYNATEKKWTGTKLTLSGKTINCKVEAWQDTGIKHLVPYTATQTTGFYLSASDAKLINEAGGLVLYGAGYTVTKVVVVSDTITVSE